MAQGSFKVSAPGKLMLLGEHAVLKGRRALVCAVDQRMYCTLKKRNDNIIHIVSALGEYKGPLDQLHDDPGFRFIVAALTLFRQRFTIRI